MIDREQIEDLFFDIVSTLKEISFYYVITLLLTNFNTHRHFLVWVIVVLALKKVIVSLTTLLNINNIAKYCLSFFISVITIGITMKFLYHLDNQELMKYIKYPVIFIFISYIYQFIRAKSYNKILKGEK